MKFNLKSVLILVIVAVSPIVSSAPNIGDTQGKIDYFTLRPMDGEHHVLRIFMSSTTKDRFECIANRGYVEVSDSHARVSTEQFQMILSMVMAAQMSGKIFSIDSTTGGEPCDQGVQAWIFTN